MGELEHRQMLEVTQQVKALGRRGGPLEGARAEWQNDECDGFDVCPDCADAQPGVASASGLSAGLRHECKRSRVGAERNSASSEERLGCKQGTDCAERAGGVWRSYGLIAERSLCKYGHWHGCMASTARSAVRVLCGLDGLWERQVPELQRSNIFIFLN